MLGRMLDWSSEPDAVEFTLSCTVVSGHPSAEHRTGLPLSASRSHLSPTFVRGTNRSPHARRLSPCS